MSQFKGKLTLYSKLFNIIIVYTNIFIFSFCNQRTNFVCFNRDKVSTDIGLDASLDKEEQNFYFKVLRKNFQKFNYEWRLSSYVHDASELNCSTLEKINSVEFIAAGWTKSTYKVKLHELTLSMKIVNIAGNDVSSCLSFGDRTVHDCHLKAASKLLNEILTLHFISHTNIIKILGYCVPVNPNFENHLHGVVIFEEYGEPINVIKILQQSWEDRLRITLGLSRLLKHLSSLKSPIALNDFRRQQFVLVKGEPKLVDVDDIGLQEPKCVLSPCCLNVSSTNNKHVCVSCINKVCHGYNEKLNILRMGNHFIKHILPHGAPSSLKSMVLSITNNFVLGSWSADDILKEVENLVTAFKNGKYREGASVFLKDFKEMKLKDISTQFDYRCHLTVSGYGCIVSVLDAEEAAEMCLADFQCKAFVFTNISTWTGRRIVHLKSGIGDLISKNSSSVYIKTYTQE